jgi:L-alanine-DL-glutamate epimerase-like enolase superfamily enzyme
MKITRLVTKIVSLPLPTPIPSARMTIKSADCVLVFLETDAGLVGEGMAFTLNGRRLALVESMIRSLEPLVLGIEPSMSGAFWRAAMGDVAFLGQRGLTVVGLSALDMALWDLRGKEAGLNISRLLGRCRDAMPAYRSGGLRLSLSIDELQREAASFVEQGFRAMKMSLGKPLASDDRARVAAVREAIGPNVRLMTDCNQQFSVAEAIRRGRALEEFNLAWIEEPVSYHDHHGEAAVAAALDTPVASGESEYTRAGMLEMLRLRSADILMPDLQRMGGPTELLKVAHYAELADVPVSLHLFSEWSLALAGALPNAEVLEYMPWFSGLYTNRIELDANGCVPLSDLPGWGFSFDPEAVARYRV